MFAFILLQVQSRYVQSDIAKLTDIFENFRLLC